MANNKKHQFKIILLSLLLAICCLIAYYFYFPDLFVISDDHNYFSTISLIQTNKEALKNLEELKKCGDWPLNQVVSNNNRGNPFVKKEVTENVMTAVSEPQCLSVSKSQ